MRIAHSSNRKIKEVEELKMLVRQLTRIEDKNQMRFKRCVFDFIGGISKILFGTIDNDDVLIMLKRCQVSKKNSLIF